MMIWCDVETTGLDPEKHHLLEVGIIVTEDDFQKVDQMSFVIEQPISITSLLEESNHFVQDMHATNGLWDDLEGCRNPKIDQAEAIFISWITTLTKGDKYPLCGNTVSFDRAWLRRHMPRLEELFHYRNIDVSTVKELYNRFAPPGDGYDKPVSQHRVLPDLEDSIAELRFYLQKMGWSS